MRLHGFSLIEMMTIMLVIGILAAVSIPAYKSYIISAKVSEARSSLSSLIFKSVALYHSDGAFPSDVTDLSLAQGTSASTTPIPATVDDYLYPYLARVTLSSAAAGTGSCAYGVIKGYVASIDGDDYITGNATNNYLDLEYIIIDVNGKIETLCYTSANTNLDLYTDITVSDCTSMTFGESPETQAAAAAYISQCP